MILLTLTRLKNKDMKVLKDNQKYCVVATVNGVRDAITGPMTKERAEAWCEMENEIPAYRREAKYPKVARYPYKSYLKRGGNR